jgi:hypothetical protein
MVQWDGGMAFLEEIQQSKPAREGLQSLWFKAWRVSPWDCTAQGLYLL